MQGELPPGRRCQILEIPHDSEVDTILAFYHNVTHTGINTTIDGIRNKYDWSGTYNNVEDFVSYSLQSFSMFHCFHHVDKSMSLVSNFMCSTSSATRERQPIPPPEEPWYH